MNTGYIQGLRREAELAASRAPRAPKPSLVGQYPGATVDEAIGGEIRAMLRAGYYETAHGTAEALDKLRSFGLGTFTALRMWTDAVNEYRGTVC